VAANVVLSPDEGMVNSALPNYLAGFEKPLCGGGKRDGKRSRPLSRMW